MLNDFFKLNVPFEKFDQARMDSQLKTSKHIMNVLFEPDILADRKVSGVTFENVSFSKTKIENVTFRDCSFVDCLFIGSSLVHVELHGCTFDNCNFYKSNFEKIYAKPWQFRKAILNPSYANIAVHLYHQLRESYYQDSQREFKNEAEYFFSKWKRKYEYLEAKRKKRPWYKYHPSHALSFAYDALFGYGYRLRNLFASTLVVVTTLVAINHLAADHFFVGCEHPSILKGASKNAPISG